MGCGQGSRVVSQMRMLYFRDVPVKPDSIGKRHFGICNAASQARLKQGRSIATLTQGQLRCISEFQMTWLRHMLRAMCSYVDRARP